MTEIIFLCVGVVAGISVAALYFYQQSQITQLKAMVEKLLEADRNKRSYSIENIALDAIAAINTLQFDRDREQAILDNAKNHLFKIVNPNGKHK